MTIRPSFLRGGLIGLVFIMFSFFWWLFIDFFGLWIVVLCQSTFLLMGSIMLVVSIKARLSINNGLVTYKVNKEIIFHMSDIECIEYHMFTKRTKDRFVTMFKIYFYDKNQNKVLQLSYFTYKKEDIRTFMKLCTEANPSCKIKKRLGNQNFKEEDIDKYL